MSSLAKLTLRTTAAAAGVAALGTGLAGPALAATPELPAVPGVAELVPALPVAAPLAALPVVSSAPALPKLFTFEMPRLHTAGPASAAPTHRPVEADEQVQDTPAAVPSTPGLRHVGALSALDSAGLFGGLLSQPLLDQRGTGTGLGSLGSISG